MSAKNATSNETSQSESRSQGGEKLAIASALLLCAGLLFGIPGAAYASSFGLSSISFSNLQITTSSGSITWQGSWYSEADASAQNSLGEYIFQSISNTGADSTAGPVTVTFATASASASVSSLSGSAYGNANVVGTGQAITSSEAILSNTFSLTGDGTVTFSLDFSGEVQAVNDPYGVLATAEDILNLSVDGTPILFSDTPISVGPSTSQITPIGGALTGTVYLDPASSHYLYIEADAETSAYNVTPEPPGAILFLSFIGLLGITAHAYRGERRSA